MRKNLRSLFTVSSSTLGSRVLGLFRDILLYAQLGLSQTNSAFLLAFTIPNLFRRLFGEGALSAALIPVLADAQEKGGKEAGFRLLNRTLSRLFLLLLGLVILFSVIVSIPIWTGASNSNRYGEAARLSLLLFPYVIPICLAALVAGSLHVLGRFFTPAITPILLNLSMIAAIGGPGVWFGETPFEKAIWLSGGVLIGGILQLGLPVIDLYRQGWRPSFDLGSDNTLTQLQGLFVPALAGAAILQVNILVSRSLAFLVEADGVALLYLAARLVELPLGLFAIAAATVLFPEFSRFAAKGEVASLRDSYRNGSALVAAVTVPSFVGLAVLGDTIVQAVFGWGLFDTADASLAAPVLALFAAGLPFYAQATLLSRAHQARQNMKTLVHVAGWVLLANFLLSLTLMVPFGIHGLAAANSLAAAVQVILLHRRLRTEIGDGKTWIPTELWKVIVGGIILATFLLLVPAVPPDADKGILFIRLLWIIPAGAVVFGLVLLLLRFGPLEETISPRLKRK
ncbi:MAG: murein biosynthesis integral membrane protein MurJ [Verrucomicrobiota bacterium]